jgi:predicted DNA-binding protein with PD1-like motif
VIVAESHRGRRLIGRLDRGVDLLEALADLCRRRRVRCAEIRAFGALESVELVEYDQREKRYRAARRFQCPLEILNFTGNVSEGAGELVVHGHITVMRDRDNGIEVLGGHLLRARIFACEFIIETLDDVVLRRSFDESTGLMLWNEKHEQPAPVASSGPIEQPATPATPMPTFEAAVPRAADQPSSTSWADVARASQAREDEPPEETFDVASLRVGDVLDHPRFGRCTIERIEGEHEFAAVRVETGRLVRLALDVLRFRLAQEDQGRRVLQVRVQR